MPAYRLQDFTGEVPKRDEQLIPDGAAQRAENTRFTSGRIDPMLAPKFVANARSVVAKTIRRIYVDNSEYWLSWDEDVDVADSAVFTENNARVVFTSKAFEPRQSNLSLATSGFPYPGQWFVLGVYTPEEKPVVTSVTGGSGTNVTRTYVYTLTTSWGEESAPSPAADVFTGTPDGVWNVYVPDATPLNSYAVTAAAYSGVRLRLTVSNMRGLRTKECVTLSGFADTNLNTSWRISELDTVNKYIYIEMNAPSSLSITSAVATRDAPHNTIGMTKNLYRSITNATGTNYYLVKTNIPMGTTAVVDDSVDTVFEPIATLGWLMPPTDMEGVVTHPSGVTAGFSGNRLFLSEPNAPYAYPFANILTLESDVVGLGVFGQTIVVCTKGKPYVVPFTTPESANPQKIEENWPCLSKQGISSFGGGVYYPTSNGLAFIGSSGSDLATKALYSKTEWTSLRPELMKAASYDNKYYALAANEDGNSDKIVVISNAEGVSTINVQATAIYTDKELGNVFVNSDGNIMQLNAAIGEFVPYSWTSKEIKFPTPQNLGAAKVDYKSDLNPSAAAAIALENINIANNNATILPNDLSDLTNDVELNEVEVNYDLLSNLVSLGEIYYLSFTLLVDGEEVYSVSLDSDAMFRLPAGRKYDKVAIKVAGTAPVQSIVFGGTPASLKAV